jgi:hypothetical protein
MKPVLNRCGIVIGIIFFVSAVDPFAVPSPASRDYPFQPGPFTSVHLNNAFWAPRLYFQP